jgi:hypothetical protein
MTSPLDLDSHYKAIKIHQGLLRYNSRVTVASWYNNNVPLLLT